MRFSSTVVQVLSFTASLASAAAIDKRQATSSVYKFSSPRSAEGIAARPNGHLLVSFMDKGEMWEIDVAGKKASKIATFTDATNSAAITDIGPDVYAVVAGQYSGGTAKAGSWGIWKVDFTSGSPVTTLIKKVPESGFWNGLTTLDNSTVLIGDASKGAVWRMDVNTGAYSIAVEDASMKPSGSLPMGIDGVRYAAGNIYYTNIFANKFYKMPVDATGKSTGAATQIWGNKMADDMYVTPEGIVYIAAQGGIQKVDAAGKVTQVAAVGSGTAVTMGKTDADKNTLYVAGSDGTITAVKLS